MPNIKSSERSVKTDAERRTRNFAVRSTLKTASRKVDEAVQAGKADEAKNLLAQATSVIDKAAAKGVIHKNAAARKKSRLARKANAAATE
ncbi:MAG TPA: 30S ribosomal protein S20 [Methylomusa anaerophila]|uniref:Small ribosomal subunit protein bS20 n=1 Tax=Methylomusa anaerophila TaxID=1930071 RepID=A0A348ANW9_9FIRM|nr:30S ribosomal protein S20 [Methylomusa anaerophila]BBB92767.1 30S ribosomal protein S20 [Methylomusa anaerophila]HML87382.1 30S ribosomal protein S20 [Methylomusa anaerophila]